MSQFWYLVDGCNKQNHLWYWGCGSKTRTARWSLKQRLMHFGLDSMQKRVTLLFYSITIRQHSLALQQH